MARIQPAAFPVALLLLACTRAIAQTPEEADSANAYEKIAGSVVLILPGGVGSRRNGSRL
jgi:hypothetical protein